MAKPQQRQRSGKNGGGVGGENGGGVEGTAAERGSVHQIGGYKMDKFFNIGVDIKNERIKVLEGIFTGDSVRMRLTLSDNGKKINFTGAQIIRLTVRKGDYKTVETIELLKEIQAAEAENGIIEIILPESFVSGKGMHQLQAALIGADGQISCARVNYIVSSAGEDAEASEEDLQTCGQLLKKAADALDAENTRATAETARKTAENSRAAAETERETAETGRKSNEENRVRNEQQRQACESDRQSSEELRKSLELGRKSDEVKRENAETARGNAEALRAAAETERVSAENSRGAAEAARAAAESARQTAENERTAAETARKTAENSRAAAEAARAAAESARQTAENERAEAEAKRADAETARAAAEDGRTAAEAARAAEENARQTAENERAAAETERQTAIAGVFNKLCPKNTVSGYPISVSDALADEQPIKLCVYGSKNMIRYPYAAATATKTVNGVTFTDNGDGTITASGTAAADAVFTIPAFTVEAKVQYFISGCPAGGSLSTYYFQMRGFTQDTGRGAKIKSSYGFTNTFEIVIKKGTAADSLVFKPQLEEGTAATEYEAGTGIGDLSSGSYTIPVKITGNGTEEKTVTAISDKPLFGGEYIDLVSKTRKGSSGTAGVTVSGDISLYDENTITCETAAAPAKLEITYYRDINKVITDLTNAILSQGGNVGL